MLNGKEHSSDTEKSTTESLLKANDGLEVKVTSDPPSKKFIKHRYFLTTAISGGFLNFGFIASSLGVSLPTFADNIGVNIDEVSSMIVARGFGYLSGSLICGLLSSIIPIVTVLVTMISILPSSVKQHRNIGALYVSAYTLLVASMFVMVIGVVFLPVLLHIVALFAFSFITSVGLSSYETIGNVAILQMWGAKSEPVIQFSHFFFSAGAAVIPFIMKPFLNEARNAADSNNSSNYSVIPELKVIENTNIPFVAIPYFFICGLILLLIVFVFIAVPPSFLNRSESQQENTMQNEGATFRKVMLALLFFFYFFYIGMEISFNAFLYTFGLTHAPGMGLSKEVSVNLNSLFYFSVVFGQFSAIFLSQKFSPTTIMVANLSGVAVSSVIMVFLPLYGDSIPQLFWVGVGGFGVFRASIYGTTFLWAERYITVNARAASVFIIGGSAGEMVLPLPVGLLIEKHPLSFLYLNISYAFIIVIFFVVMWKVANTKGERLKKVDVKDTDSFPVQVES